MSFRVDGYIQDWLLFLDTGESSCLKRSIAELKPDDSVTGGGFIRFAEGVSLLANVTEMLVLCLRIQQLMGTQAGECVSSFIRNQPSYFKVADADTAGAYISQTQKTISAWTLILHLTAERTYGVVSTYRPFNRLLRSLTLDYLDQPASHTQRKRLFQNIGVSALAEDAFYRKVASSIHLSLTANDGDFHDAVVASKKGFEGLADTGLDLSLYMGYLTPSITSKRFKQPMYFKRALEIYAEVLVRNDQRPPWPHLVRLFENGDYARSASVELALRKFFLRGYEAKGKAFATWATTLSAYGQKHEIIDLLWEKPGFLQRLEDLEGSLTVSLFHGSRMKRELLRRYPEHIDTSFSCDLGI
ncbi:hypothetical protein [Pseudomonas amygdali]|uniref:Uncharacterized protein n=2 Tax=Pseudomonas amygdali pv. lachrymans TaxID=53707 RepID=A0ABR5KRT7_PSEAV|nr:hypothetical protein [Pseudomonas amygdali]AXH60106.1 hypothetical protein PLA107_033390 [Pseudomonas amygdali pv. lachrymans str. M301315]KPC17512.1 Uncharacterized protein AC499_0714 [Pseudomonas amygdali pv. lachrymans]RMT06058.1 hypothetical protein ALP54_03953 [Pseudomonas amygdali pv. lachrymans]